MMGFCAQLAAIVSFGRQMQSFSMMASYKKPVTLITFDVDGTLVHGNPARSHEAHSHAKAFLFAVGKEFGNDLNFQKKHTSPLDFLPKEKYHGSTDGLILLNLAKFAFNVPVKESAPKLQALFHNMQAYFSTIPDEVITDEIIALPGVLESFETIRKNKDFRGRLLCGLVTGNVEGIARKKMRACGILRTGVLSPKAPDQNWEGEAQSAFLGGFGSDFCSCNIDEPSRNYKDRGEQIVLAYRRACTLLLENEEIVRVVHVGDAPSDILAAKWCYEEEKFGPGVTVGCIGVGTGRYSCTDLSQIAGVPVVGKWEPAILPDGICDPTFIEKCGIILK